MAGSGQVAESLARRYAVLRPHLDERQRRLLLGTEAAELGRGGIKAVAAATGVHPDTVARGLREIEGQPEPQQPVRAAGGGRKMLSETNPALAAQLQALVDPQTRGDPMSLLVWTTKSTKNLAAALTSSGHPVSDRTVARMLQALGFSLQGNAKVIEGRQHADRDAQFRYLAAQAAEHAGAGQPVISVDGSCDTRSHVASELAVRRPARTRRLLATVLLLALPLAATTACAEDEGSDDGGVEQEEEDDD